MANTITYAIKITREDGFTFTKPTGSLEEGLILVRILGDLGHKAELLQF